MMPQARGHGAVLDEDAVDLFGIPPVLALLEHRGPVRAVELHGVVPLGIMAGLRHRLLAFELVDRAALLVEIKRRVEHPDLLGVVARGTAVDLVRHLHGGDVLAHLFRRRHVLGRGPGDLVRGPAVAVVVAVRDAHGLEHAQGRNRAAAAEAVVERHAEIPGKPIVLGPPGELVAKGSRHLADQPVVVGVALVEKRIGQPLEEPHDRVGRAAHLAHLGMKLRPQCLHARELAQRQTLDARVLEEADEEHLRRVELLHRERAGGVDEVRRRVGRGRAVEPRDRAAPRSRRRRPAGGSPATR